MWANRRFAIQETGASTAGGGTRTPLRWAALGNENPKVIESLLRAGADIEERNILGHTPLMWAASKNKNPEVIETLLRAGANAKAKDKKGKTAADHAKDNKKIYKTKVYWKLNRIRRFGAISPRAAPK